MIIVDLYGGLGNQMFQYAAAYRLALELNTELILNTHALKYDSRRSYALHAFWVNNQIIEFDVEHASALKKHLYGIPTLLTKYKEVEEFVYDQNLKFLSGHCYINGYWQNPDYFRDIKDVIASVFSLRSPSPDYLKLLNEIRQQPSISMHVRRGDFISHSLAQSKHDICGYDYYINALGQMQALFQSKTTPVYIFSDDHFWCRQHFDKIKNVHFVKTSSDAEDLMLMAECNYNIIANSTFSWWAAWLNKHDDKIVMAPSQWLKDDFQVKSSNIILEDWQKLPV
jgi:hypothetical protein